MGILASGSAVEAATLYRLTAGNPFYVTEVLRAGLMRSRCGARAATGCESDATHLLAVANWYLCRPDESAAGAAAAVAILEPLGRPPSWPGRTAVWPARG